MADILIKFRRFFFCGYACYLTDEWGGFLVGIQLQNSYNISAAIKLRQILAYNKLKLKLVHSGDVAGLFLAMNHLI